MTARIPLRDIDYGDVMHPDDKNIVDWLNGLRVPYYSLGEFVKEITRHPFDKSLKQWYEIFKAGKDYYTFQDFLKSTTSKCRETYVEIEYQGEGLNVTKDNLPQMHQQLTDACEILGMNDIPAYSTDWYYGPFSMSCGEKNKRVVMMSGSADLLTEDEMMFLIGHELGHFISGHKPYHMLVECFYLPMANDAAFKAWASIIKMPLLEWYRTSDYTADRIGLLCCQNINVALSTMIKKAGLPKKCYDDIDIQEFIKQAKDFDEQCTGWINNAIKVLSIRSAESPWLVARAVALMKWYESDSYEKIIRNN